MAAVKFDKSKFISQIPQRVLPGFILFSTRKGGGSGPGVVGLPSKPEHPMLIRKIRNRVPNTKNDKRGIVQTS
jgi:hypothetical protein